ncbi:MAG TPA: hypothetical protein PK657_14775 [Legionella sp.]|nr:hypothetical protein [Legionella sp.]
MPTKQRTQEIISLFQQYLKYGDMSLIEELSLKELETADTDLAWRDKDSSWRMAIQKRIMELKQEKQDSEAARKHCQNIWIANLSILITIIIALLSWFYFK